MNIYLALLLIALAIVNLVDLSGFVDTVKHWVWKWVFKDKRPYQDFDFRPFQCSYCMTHHIGLIYILCVGELSLATYAYLLFLAFLTPVFKDILILFKDICIKVIDTIYYYLGL